MIAITAPRKDGKYDLILVMEQPNLDRLKEHDPAELPLDSFNLSKLNAFRVAYATPEEMKRITSLPQMPLGDVLKILFKGWKYKPEEGDNDAGPQRILQN